MSCVIAATQAYAVPQSDVINVIESVEQRKNQTGTGANEGSSGGIMGIPSPWLPVLERYGFNVKDVTSNDCQNIAAGTFILALSQQARVSACESQAAAIYGIPESALMQQIAVASAAQGGVGLLHWSSAQISRLRSAGFPVQGVLHDPCWSAAAMSWMMAANGMRVNIPLAQRPQAAPPAQYAPMIEAASRYYGVPANLIKAVIAQESSYNPNIESPAGAVGLMQLIPSTAARFGVKNRRDPWQSIMGGTAYLASLLRTYSGNVELALAGYNAGEAAVNRYGGIPPYKETRNYVPSVLSRYVAYNTGNVR